MSTQHPPRPLQNALPTPSSEMISETVSFLIGTANQWIRVSKEEKLKQNELQTQKEVQLASMRIQKDFLLTALDKTFDERKENFRRLFDSLDIALNSKREDAGAQVSGILDSITVLTKESPFKDLQSPTIVVEEFFRGDRVFEL